MEYVVDRKWKWVQCNLVIKRLPHKQYQEGVYQSLQAEVQLTSQESDIKNFQSQIVMQKSFEFQQGRGFIWHKSWYIPEIVLKLSSKITRMLKQENQIKKIYCQMLSGYPFKKEEHFYLQQVRLQGDTLRQFNKKGQVSFSNIKFSQTSFNKNKNKFSIILVIYTSYKENQRSIIKSYISSPIHVDSRKQARKKISATTFIQDEFNINKFLTKLQGWEKLIGQNFDYDDIFTIYGFIKYYTAANIRFKIKHPYYIGYHFSNVFEIYYNTDEANDPVDVLEIIYQNQMKENDKPKTKIKDKKELFTDNKEILKKTSPKILLFLIKNTPKDCLLIKDEHPQFNEKPFPFDQRSISPHQKPAPQISNQQENQNQLEQSKQLPNDIIAKQVKQIFQPINEQSLVSVGLSHILQPVNKKVSNERVDKEIKEIEENNQDLSNEMQKVIKEEEHSESQIQLFSKNGSNQPNQHVKKEHLKNQLIKEEEAIKKIYSIFESWKFNFVHLKKSDGGLNVINKKWAHIPPQDLLESFKTYTKKKSTKTSENGRRISDEPGGSNTNANSYLSYQIHQVVVLQKSKIQVKKQQNYFSARKQSDNIS